MPWPFTRRRGEEAEVADRSVIDELRKATDAMKKQAQELTTSAREMKEKVHG